MANLKGKNDFDIFNVSIDDIAIDDKKGNGNSNLYSPKYDQAADGVYKSKIRFIPNINNPRKSILRKYVYFLKNKGAETGGFYVDSPSTIGEKCPIQDMFFKLRNSESAADKKASEALKRKEVYYSYAQIIEDKQQPDLEGKIMIFKYGFKVKQKIDEQLHPVVDDEDPVNVFDLFEGRDFNLVVCKKDGFANYDSSKFSSKITAIKINGKEMSDDDDDKETIINYIKENAPDISEFEYKDWDDDVKSKVANVLKTYMSPGEAIGKVTNKSNEMTFNDDEDDTPKKKSSKKDDEYEDDTPKKKETKSKKKDDESNVDSDDDDFDKFLEDIDNI